MTAVRQRLAGLRDGLPEGADAAIAVLLGAFGLLDVLVLQLTPELSARVWPAAVFACAVPVAVGVRRTRPVLAAITGAALIGLQAVLVAPATALAQVLGLLILSFSLGAHARPAWAVALSWSALLAAVVAVAVMSGSSVGGLLAVPLFLGVPFLAGLAVRISRQHAHRIAALSAELLAERERSAALVVAQERNRVARELHDLIAHGVGVMTVQAAGGRRILTQDPDRAGAALGAIETTGRQALRDLERTIAVLRDPTGEVTPTGDLDNLPGLLARLREGGSAIDMGTDDQLARVFPAVRRAAFMIVKESLTNAVKHGGGGRIRADVRLCDGFVEVTVTNPLPVAHGGSPLSGGHGLVGMQERVNLFGGELHAGPTPDGRYLVRARLPLPDSQS